MASLLPRALALSAALSLLLGVAVAGATTPTSTTTTTTTTTSSTTTVPSKPKPKPKPAASGTLHVHTTGLFSVAGQPMTVPGRGVWVSGVVRPYVAHQVVTMRVVLSGRTIATRRVGVAASRGRTYGHFSLRLAPRSSGGLTVLISHSASAQQKSFSGRAGYAIVDPHAGFGATGRFVELIQQRLQSLHIFVRRTGVYDGQTGLAIDAYHRLMRWGTSQSLGPATIGALMAGRGAFHIRYPSQGHHAEGNLGLQLLALADGSRVRYIYPISSGKPSTPTILGSFRVYRRDPGYLPDGMYYSSFFTGGYAIHGFDPAPDYPASHGCMRVPIGDAIPIYYWLGFGNWVDSYY